MQRRPCRLALFVAACLVVPASTVAAQRPEAGRVFNPSSSPGSGSVISYERLEGTRRFIEFRRASNGEVFTLATAASKETQAVSFLFDGSETSSYEGELAWRPIIEDGRTWFAYVAADQQGTRLLLNYVDRSGKLSTKEPLQMPFPGKARFPRWSPNGKHLVFVSDSAVVHIASNVSDAILSGNAQAITIVRQKESTRPAGFPQWSPVGDHIAYDVETVTRGVRNRAIEVLPVDQKVGRSTAPPRIVTEGMANSNEYRPAWSPDGKYVAFYSDASGFAAGGSRTIQIGVVEIQLNPNTRKVMRGEVKEGRSAWIAEDVIPNEARGPVWTSVNDQNEPRPAIVYVRRDAERDNPIIAVSLSRWLDGLARAQSERMLTNTPTWNTVNNKFVSASEIRTAKVMRYVFVSVEGGGEKVQSKDEAAPWLREFAEDRSSNAVVRAIAFPGLGQFANGQNGTGGAVMGLAVAGIAAGVVGFGSMSSSRSEGNAIIAKQLLQVSPQNAADFATQESKFSSGKTVALVGLGITAGAWIYGIWRAGNVEEEAGPARVSIRVLPEGILGTGRVTTFASRVQLSIPFGGPRR